MELSWVRLSFSPPCWPCCSLGGETVLWDGEGMRCLCHLYFLAVLRYIQAVSVRSRKCRGGRCSSSSSPTSVHSVSSQRKTCQVSHMGGVAYRWLSGLGTNEPPVWKYWLLWSMVASACFPLPFMSNPTWQQSLVNAFKGPGMNQCLAKEWDNNGDWRNGFY